MDQRQPPRLKAQDVKAKSRLPTSLIREYPFMVSTCDPDMDSATMADALVCGRGGVTVTAALAAAASEVGALLELEHQLAAVVSRPRNMANVRVVAVTAMNLTAGRARDRIGGQTRGVAGVTYI